MRLEKSPLYHTSFAGLKKIVEKNGEPKKTVNQTVKKNGEPKTVNQKTVTQIEKKTVEKKTVNQKRLTKKR